jgi:hypothetical protein
MCEIWAKYLHLLRTAEGDTDTIAINDTAMSTVEKCFRQQFLTTHSLESRSKSLIISMKSFKQETKAAHHTVGTLARLFLIIRF